MRQLLTLLVLAGLGYFGWQTWQKHPEYFTKFLPKQEKPEEAVAPESTTPGGSVTAPALPAPVAPTPRPSPQFVSKIVVPAAPEGEKAMMPPGHFLVTERASAETNDGVVAVVPGDSVKLVERKGDGTLRVTDGKVIFTLRETQLTQDVEVAQAAERRDFERKYGVQ